jgi:hypothetical protein
MIIINLERIPVARNIEIHNFNADYVVIISTQRCHRDRHTAFGIAIGIAHRARAPTMFARLNRLFGRRQCPPFSSSARHGSRISRRSISSNLAFQGITDRLVDRLAEIDDRVEHKNVPGRNALRL